MLKLFLLVLLTCYYGSSIADAAACQAKDHLILKFYSTKKTWADARKYCQSDNLHGILKGDLVVDTKTATHTFIKSQVLDGYEL